MSLFADKGFAKVNLALHVRGRLPDGRHRLETLFAFCESGDGLTVKEDDALSLHVSGPFADPLLSCENNLAMVAAQKLRAAANVRNGAALTLEKRLPVASGIGGGSADAAAALRLLTGLWQLDPSIAEQIAPAIGADVPACLLSRTCIGGEAGDEVRPFDDAGIAGAPILLVNPGVEVSTGAVFQRWDGEDRGPLGGWRNGRNDLETPAMQIAPVIADVLDWLSRREGANLVRMSGSGATCFALFDDESARDSAAAEVPNGWWHLASRLR